MTNYDVCAVVHVTSVLATTAAPITNLYFKYRDSGQVANLLDTLDD